MKTHLYQAVLLAGMIGFSAAPGRGQMLTANIPFDFQTSNAKMPPGEYSVRQLQSGSPAIVLNNWDTHKSDIVLATPMTGKSSDNRPRLIFNCLDNRCALAEIWGATSSGGAQLLPSRSKKKDRDHLAVVFLKSEAAGK